MSYHPQGMMPLMPPQPYMHGGMMPPPGYMNPDYAVYNAAPTYYQVGNSKIELVLNLNLTAKCSDLQC